MERANELALRPGYISGYEVLTRVAAALAGPGVAWAKTGQAGVWFTAQTDGRLIIQKDMLRQVKKLSYINVSSWNNRGLIRKNEVLGSFRITQKIVPEDGVRYLENLLPCVGCLLTVKPTNKQLVVISPVGRKKVGSLLMLTTDC